MLRTGKEQTQKISSQMNALKAEGIDLKKEIGILEKDDEDQKIKQLKEQEEAAFKKKEEEESKKREAAEMAHWYYPLKKNYHATAAYMAPYLVHLAPVKTFTINMYGHAKTIGTNLCGHLVSVYMVCKKGCESVYEMILAFFNKKMHKDDKAVDSKQNQKTPDMKSSSESKTAEKKDDKVVVKTDKQKHTEIQKTDSVKVEEPKVEQKKVESSSSEPAHESNAAASKADKKDILNDYYQYPTEKIIQPNFDMQYYGRTQ